MFCVVKKLKDDPHEAGSLLQSFISSLLSIEEKEYRDGYQGAMYEPDHASPLICTHEENWY